MKKISVLLFSLLFVFVSVCNAQKQEILLQKGLQLWDRSNSETATSWGAEDIYFLGNIDDYNVLYVSGISFENGKGTTWGIIRIVDEEGEIMNDFDLDTHIEDLNLDSDIFTYPFLVDSTIEIRNLDDDTVLDDIFINGRLQFLSNN